MLAGEAVVDVGSPSDGMMHADVKWVSRDRNLGRNSKRSTDVDPSLACEPNRFQEIFLEDVMFKFIHFP